MNCDNVTITNTITSLTEHSLKFHASKGEGKDEGEGEDECELNYYYDRNAQPLIPTRSAAIYPNPVYVTMFIVHPR